MKRGILIGIAFMASLVLFPWQNAGAKVVMAEGTMLSKRCLLCHINYADMENVLGGDMYAHSGEDKLIEVHINKKIRVVRYKDGVRVDNLKNGIDDLYGDHHVRVHYEKVGPELIVTKIVAKPEVEVSKSRRISTGEMEKLVAMGPEKGNYVLVASNSDGTFKMERIPTAAVYIPYSKMRKMMNKLPKDKEKTVIFYCGGVR